MKVSVFMPVLNAMPHLESAVESILRQSHQDLELIVLENGSSDASRQFLESIALHDKRMKLHTREQPLGMVGSSNEAFELTTSKFVARMDADDVSHPRRLETQIEILENSNAALTGILSNGIDGLGREVRPRDRWGLTKRSWIAPFAHGSIMFKREAFIAVGGYREDTDGYEDQDLYQRIALVGNILVIAEPLYSFRFHSTNWTFNELIRAGERGFPQAFTHLLWSGGRLPFIRLDLLKDRSRSSILQLLLLGTWGSVAPRSLRKLFAMSIRLRDAAAGFALSRRGHLSVVPWSPGPRPPA